MNESELPQEKYLEIEEVWNAFVQQLQKDALMSGIELKESLFLMKALSEVILKISEELKHIIDSSNGFEKIQTWLYRVDVQENLLKTKLYQNKDDYSIIAELIVKRTLQKIIIRYLHKWNRL
ncbi:MAG: hypothetical protein N2203_05090 [Bacteroidia bacterium]|nr:hypothetical protein [Bacteroidia bacterium]